MFLLLYIMTSTNIANSIKTNAIDIEEKYKNIDYCVGAFHNFTCAALNKPNKSFWYSDHNYVVALVDNKFLNNCEHIKIVFNPFGGNDETKLCGSGDMHLYVDHNSVFMNELKQSFDNIGFRLIDIAFNDIHGTNFAVYLRVL